MTQNKPIAPSLPSRDFLALSARGKYIPPHPWEDEFPSVIYLLKNMVYYSNDF
jgi:hypothetical protein